MILKKLCSILLALFLVVCTSPIAFAEEVVEEIPTAPSEIETVVEDNSTDAAVAEEQPSVVEKEEEKEASPVEEKVETPINAVEEEKEEIKAPVKSAPAALTVTAPSANTTTINEPAQTENESFKVTYNVYYRSESHGQVNGWVKGASKVITVVNGKSNSSSTSINVAYRQMSGNGVANRDVRYNKVKYRFTGAWADENGNTHDPNNIEYNTSYKCNGSGYVEDTTVNIYAQYTATPICDFQVNYEDKLGHTSSEWNTVNGSASGYTHTFKEAVDVPENYQFLYWQNSDNVNEKYTANSQLSVDIDSLVNDPTIYTYVAMYQPAVIVNYYNGDKLVNTVQSFNEVKVYDYSIEDSLFDGWYDENNTKISNDQIYNAPEITADGDYKVINVVAKFVDPTPDPQPIPTPDPQPTPTPDPVTPVNPIIPNPTPTPTPTIIPIGGGDGEDYEIITVAETSTPAAMITNTPAEEPIEINDIKIPLAKTEETWALVNLIAMVVTVTVSLILTILGWYNRWRRRNIELDEDENEKYQFWLRNKILFRIINSALAIISIIAFILTENIFLKLVFVDRFTPLMIAFAILAIGAAFFSKYVIKEYYPQTQEDIDDDDDEDEE